MTVKELIENLQKCPQDMEVVYYCGSYFGNMGGIYIEKHNNISSDGIHTEKYFLVIKEK